MKIIFREEGWEGVRVLPKGKGGELYGPQGYDS